MLLTSAHLLSPPVDAALVQILPHHTSNPRYAMPAPPGSTIPASYEFPVSELDAKDGFLHFSTSTQVSSPSGSRRLSLRSRGGALLIRPSVAEQLAGTLNRFFADEKAVTLLKCDYGRLSGFKVVKWEQAGSGGGTPRTRISDSASARGPKLTLATRHRARSLPALVRAARGGER